MSHNGHSAPLLVTTAQKEEARQFYNLCFCRPWNYGIITEARWTDPPTLDTNLSPVLRIPHDTNGSQTATTERSRTDSNPGVLITFNSTHADTEMRIPKRPGLEAKLRACLGQEGRACRCLELLDLAGRRACELKATTECVNDPKHLETARDSPKQGDRIATIPAMGWRDPH